MPKATKDSLGVPVNAAACCIAQLMSPEKEGEASQKIKRLAELADLVESENFRHQRRIQSWIAPTEASEDHLKSWTLALAWLEFVQVYQRFEIPYRTSDRRPHIADGQASTADWHNLDC